MHTGNPLTMSEAVHTFALLDTHKMATILTREGETYATDELVGRMRAAYPEKWAALILRLHRSTRWSDFDAAEIRQARDICGLNSTARRTVAA